jgi:hypothetical protein
MYPVQHGEGSLMTCGLFDNLDMEFPINSKKQNLCGKK